eukprot:TRINITY_DN5842_c0_g1_i1.p1 TRINITY_DN5842_c0_g1~~TRINITY_DN5842_c0_g1_i1.p1  ORF type:complete len:520 (+),score=112.51 TRINITY_DN5842_c0_g1_i1:466-2025(+)
MTSTLTAFATEPVLNPLRSHTKKETFREWYRDNGAGSVVPTSGSESDKTFEITVPKDPSAHDWRDSYVKVEFKIMKDTVNADGSSNSGQPLLPLAAYAINSTFYDDATPAGGRAATTGDFVTLSTNGASIFSSVKLECNGTTVHNINDFNFAVYPQMAYTMNDEYVQTKGPHEWIYPRDPRIYGGRSNVTANVDGARPDDAWNPNTALGLTAWRTNVSNIVILRIPLKSIFPFFMYMPHVTTNTTFKFSFTVNKDLQLFIQRVPRNGTTAGTAWLWPRMVWNGNGVSVMAKTVDLGVDDAERLAIFKKEDKPVYIDYETMQVHRSAWTTNATLDMSINLVNNTWIDKIVVGVIKQDEYTGETAQSSLFTNNIYLTNLQLQYNDISVPTKPMEIKYLQGLRDVGESYEWFLQSKRAYGSYRDEISRVSTSSTDTYLSHDMFQLHPFYVFDIKNSVDQGSGQSQPQVVIKADVFQNINNPPTTPWMPVAIVYFSKRAKIRMGSEQCEVSNSATSLRTVEGP